MAKKILILSASPRKHGNSDILSDEFAKGATEAGNQVEKIFIMGKKINYCRGCEVCDSTHQCIQDDDMDEILEKMVQADVIVLASPVYFYTIDGQMKTLIDRTVPRYMEISNKEFYYIITAADTNISNMQKAIECFRGFTMDCLSGSVERGILLGLGIWHKGEVEKTRYIEEAYTMGKNV